LSRTAEAVAEGFVVAVEQGAFDHDVTCQDGCWIYGKAVAWQKSILPSGIATATARTAPTHPVPRRAGDTMTEAFIFDAIRTPRGKGKKDGSLHEVKPVNLLAGVLTELQRRNDFDTAAVDDVVMGVVSPVGEQGSVIAKVAALKAGWDWRCSGVQLNRFCASGLEAVNMAAQKVRSGWEDLVVAGGVESMSRVPIGSDGGAWAQDPETNSATAVRAAGHRRRPDRHAGRLHAARTWTPSRWSRRSAPPPRARRLLRRLGGAGEGRLGQTILDHDEFIKPHTTMEGLAGLKPAFEQLGAMGFDAVAISATRRSSASATCTTRATPRASSTAPRPC
jgi:acetyl-CoA C-acetyltransferase